MKTIERQLLSLINVAGNAPTRDLIQIMAYLDVADSYVRITLADLKKAGYLIQPSRGHYAASSMAVAYLNELHEKFSRVARQEVDTLTLVAAQFEDQHRPQRQRFRQHLMTVGFGQVQKGLYLATGDRLGELQHLISQHDLEDKVQLYLTTALFPPLSKGRARTIWHLEDVEERLQAIDDWTRRQLMPQIQSLTSNGARIACYLEMISQLAEVYVIDPMLPESLVGQDWVGTRCIRELVQAGQQLVASRDPEGPFIQFFDQSVLNYTS